MKWTLEKRKIEEVYPNARNPRQISKRQAKELEISLRKFGLCQPIVLGFTGNVLGGHQRLKVLRSLGYSTIDVYLPTDPLTQEEEDELSIRLNKNIGSWDIDMLANHWDCEKLLDSGFSMEELQLESVPHAKNPPTKFTLTIQCKTEEQLETMESAMPMLLDQHHGASYKVKIK